MGTFADERQSGAGVALDLRPAAGPRLLAAAPNVPPAERLRADPEYVRALQRTAGNAAVARMIAAPAPGPRLMRHPARSVLIKAGKWLAGRGAQQISKHIAKHGRRIAGKAVHSIFRMPRHIKTYVATAIREAEALASKAGEHAAETVLEEGGVRVFRQAGRTPGKFRTIVEKEFATEIGTRGETVLKIVIDASGRLVTAYPMHKVVGIALGVGAAGTALFDARTAEAAERIRSAIEAEHQEEDFDLVTEIIDFVVSPSVANEGEDLLLEIDRIVHETKREVIAEVEAAEGVCLPQEDLQAIEELVEIATSTPMVLEEE
jgi:hypothetical protein